MRLGRNQEGWGWWWGEPKLAEKVKIDLKEKWPSRVRWMWIKSQLSH